MTSDISRSLQTYEGAPAKEYVTGKGSNSAMNPSSPCSDPPRELGTAVLHTVQSTRTWKVERAAQSQKLIASYRVAHVQLIASPSRRFGIYSSEMGQFSRTG
jgi:hypothetical protein